MLVTDCLMVIPVDLSAHHPGGEKKNPCMPLSSLPCPPAERVCLRWEQSRSLIACMLGTITEPAVVVMDHVVVLEERPWIDSGVAQPCVILSTEISARERKKALSYSSVLSRLLNELIAHITPTSVHLKHKELLLSC